MGKLSHKKQIEKYGGEKGYAEEMRRRQNVYRKKFGSARKFAERMKDVRAGKTQ